MKIGRIYYPVNVLGYGKRIGIWLCGCEKKCINCISPEFQDEKSGEVLSIVQIVGIIKDFEDVIDGITISGGEPLKQAAELKVLIENLLLIGIDDILIYSGYTRKELETIGNSDINFILSNAACVILGEYREEENDGVGIRGSTNQEIVVNKFKERYKDAANCIRKQQIVFSEKRTIIIGIPPKENK